MKIPEGWKEKPLEKICDLQAGKFISATEIKETNDGTSYPCYGGNGLRGYVDRYSHDGIFPLIGRQGALCGNINKASGKFYATEHAVVATPCSNIEVNWLYFQLLFSDLNKYATGAAQPGLSVNNIKKISVPLPPLPEQKAIADILSTWDEAIEKTEKLIKEKERRFRGLLSSLIKEKDGWKKVKLGDVGEIKKGTGITKSDLTDEGISCIRYAEIYTTYHYHVSEFYCFVPETVFNSALEIINGDILFAASGETQEEIGKCVAYLGSKKACTGGDTIVLRIKPYKCDPMFLGFALNAPIINKQKSAYAHGNSVVHLYGKDLLKVEMFLPPLPKQIKIAETLNTAQDEINILKKLSEQYKRQKQGLMQKLLTGEWRVRNV